MLRLEPVGEWVSGWVSALHERCPRAQSRVCVWHSREVALQHEDGGRVLQPGDLSRHMNMTYDEFVCLSHICESIYAAMASVAILRDIYTHKADCTPLVRRASAPVHCKAHAHTRTRAHAMASGQQMGLRALLLGTPLRDRQKEGGEDEGAKVASGIDVHLLALVELLPKIYDDREPCRQAVLEVGAVVDMKATRKCIACKRAMLLYSIAAENDVCDHWKGRISDGSADLAIDLNRRVLPFLTPRFFKHSCQSPDSFVTLAVMLAEMWQGEDLGNFKAAHHDCSSGKLHQRKDSELA